MKIPVKALPYSQVMALPRPPHRDPVRPNPFLRLLIRTLAAGELKKVHFRADTAALSQVPPTEPALILMNHSSFIDLSIAARILADRPYNIVTTSDGFVGKEGLMYAIGCFPTEKFVGDLTLIRDLRCCLETLRTSVLMFPEASYSFDGTATPLPASLGKLLRVLKVPVLMIRTEGAFQRDPLYNGLRLRNCDVTAKTELLFTREECASLSVSELNERLAQAFSFDHFRWQKENGIKITEDFRAEGLSRVLYKCCSCGSETGMEGRGTKLVCRSCGRSWTLSELGEILPDEGESKFTHIPDWYRWERECVRKELEEGTYALDIPVTIRMMVDKKAIYTVGRGRLRHSAEGFVLTGFDREDGSSTGELLYRQPPLFSYSLYADYFWYEIGDMICIGSKDALYYCFPDEGTDVAAKTRLAAEELYKLRKARVGAGRRQ